MLLEFLPSPFAPEAPTLHLLEKTHPIFLKDECKVIFLEQAEGGIPSPVLHRCPGHPLHSLLTHRLGFRHSKNGFATLIRKPIEVNRARRAAIAKPGPRLRGPQRIEGG